MNMVGPFLGMRHESLFHRGLCFGAWRTLENLLQRIEDESLPLKVKALVLHRPATRNRSLHRTISPSITLMRKIGNHAITFSKHSTQISWCWPDGYGRSPCPRRFPPSTSTPLSFPNTAVLACMGYVCTKRLLQQMNCQWLHHPSGD